MKGKYIFSIMLAALIFASCEKRSAFVIEGNIPNLTSNTLYIVTNTPTTIDTITIQAKEGKFEYEASSDSVVPIRINMEQGNVWITVWAKNEDKITIKGDVNCPELIEIEGNEINDLLTEFKMKNKKSIRERCDLSDKKDPADAERISQIEQSLKTEAEAFIKEHPSSIAGLVLILDYLLDKENKEKIEPYLSLITGDARNDELYQKLSATVERCRRTAIGSPAPDFSLITAKNDTLSLDTFKNKFLLLTFDASWCDVCNEDYSALVKLRKKFPKDKLEILTVALDENKADWEKLAQKEKINWYQVTDTYGLASDMVSLYNISSIPNNFLIDKKGIIFAKDISTDSIKTLLRKELGVRN